MEGVVMSILFEISPDGDRYIAWLLSGLGWTLVLAVLSSLIAFVVGVIVGAARTSDKWAVSLTGRLYVQIFRNIPLIVQMFIWYFLVPDLLPQKLGDSIKHLNPPWGAFFPALICLGLYTASRVAEQVRAGINALPRGQWEAADALGLSRFKSYRAILLPQALRIIIPTLTSEAMGAFKNTSVALTIGLLELTAQARQMNEFTFRTFEAFGTATFMYLLVALVIYQGMTLIERKLKIPGLRTDSRPTK